MHQNKKYPVTKTDEEWKASLTPDEYRVLRQKGTERPHTGEYNLHFEEGEYRCRACDTKLFESDSKFNSGCGWPSFDKSIEGTVEYLRDTSHGMIRTEILCANCGGHLGHVFDDGPTDTGQRYCVNSLSIDFKKE
ncbi:peptide-methionine (R)-S-oxide reductase MsrB [Flavobacteriaceae bacterium R38]|nr:peptide-methionine (R)-S-oxide reductase MsrB [Flavobacteriaceae bacterium R38]